MAKLYAGEEEARTVNMVKGRKTASDRVPYQPVKRGQTVIKSKKEGSEPKGQVLKLKLKLSKAR